MVLQIGALAVIAFGAYYAKRTTKSNPKPRKQKESSQEEEQELKGLKPLK